MIRDVYDWLRATYALYPNIIMSFMQSIANIISLGLCVTLTGITTIGDNGAKCQKEKAFFYVLYGVFLLLSVFTQVGYFCVYKSVVLPYRVLFPIVSLFFFAIGCLSIFCGCRLRKVLHQESVSSITSDYLTECTFNVPEKFRIASVGYIAGKASVGSRSSFKVAGQDNVLLRKYRESGFTEFIVVYYNSTGRIISLMPVMDCSDEFIKEHCYVQYSGNLKLQLEQNSRAE